MALFDSEAIAIGGASNEWCLLCAALAVNTAVAVDNGLAIAVGHAETGPWCAVCGTSS